MKNLKIAALTLVCMVGYVTFSLNAYGQTNTKSCVVHVLTQGGSPTAQTVKVCN